ncbi:hypothetical protein BAMA_01550 [Bacillus manliponensis]|uniref:Uncharacterized protein n=1 Tax=Bacillus manliponensis TaxID=574376 RepID=A0A073K4L6_9BACI|nr:hypothetical protein [Bacillus manliponensis]KEK21481.1 hypothetical protein BAMA_01550 [Bacillus manliponensis]
MENDFTSYASLDLVEHFDFVTIDLQRKFFVVHIVEVKTDKILLKVFINYDEDDVRIEGDTAHYETMDIACLIESLKVTAKLCIENDLCNDEELETFLRS